MEFEEDKNIKIIEKFEELELNRDVLKGIYAHGWEKPSDIQQRAILPMKDGKDMIAQAQSGTGKSGSFVIGGLTRVDESVKKTPSINLI